MAGEKKVVDTALPEFYEAMEKPTQKRLHMKH
jgi:hypothetical protein